MFTFDLRLTFGFSGKIPLLLGAILLCQGIQAQVEPENDSKHALISAYDTTYIIKYDAALSVGPSLSYRNYNLLVLPKTTADRVFVPRLRWRSPSNRFWGLDVNYDKFGFTMSIASFAPKFEREKKGTSSSSSFVFSYGGNRCFLELNAMNFKGFYEANSALLDTTLDTYYQSPSLSSTLVNAKVFYFTNHRKYAVKSSYGGLYRQIKTRASWVFAGNLHVNEILTDTSIVPYQDSNYFDNALQVRAIECGGLSLMGGGAVNLVIRKGYFINLGWVMGPDLQAMELKTKDVTLSRSYVSFAQDFRLATGFNTSRWYFTFTWKHETNRFIHDFLETRTRLNSFSLNLGWRFNIKTPKLYQRFQRTWFYNIF